MTTFVTMASTNVWNTGTNSFIWRTFDKSNMFAVEQNTQAKYIILSMVICIPDIYSCTWEVPWYRDIIFMKHPNAKTYLDSINPTLEPFIFSSMFWLHMMNSICKYRPIVVLLYSILCMYKHLICLNLQLGVQSNNHDIDALVSMPVKTTHKVTDRRSVFEDIMKNIDDKDSITNRFNSAARLSESSVCSADLAVGSRFGLGQYHLMSKQTKDRTSTLVLEISVNETLRNLHELEVHLTRLNLFLKQVDIEVASAVYLTSLYHFGALFYFVFLFKEMSSDYSFLRLTLYSLGRVLPAASLFICGTLMERQVRRLLAQLEHIYLQEDTQCFMYRQLSGLKFPLWSIFKLLGSIEFDCDQLMHINLGTMRELLILLGACAFLVIQYGKYVVEEE